MNLYLKIEINKDKFQDIDLYGDRITIGRDEKNRIAIDQSFVSSRHAIITRDDEGSYFIEDCESSNGTFLNNVRLKKEKRYFKDGDKIKIGKLELLVERRNKNAISVVPLRQRRPGQDEVTTL